MPKNQNQPSEQPTPPDVATKEEKHQETEVLAEGSPENQQADEIAE